jgi:hypothetical protein
MDGNSLVGQLARRGQGPGSLRRTLYQRRGGMLRFTKGRDPGCTGSCRCGGPA